MIVVLAAIGSSQTLQCYDLLECGGLYVSGHMAIDCWGELSCNKSVISPISHNSSLEVGCLGSHSSMNLIFYNVPSIISFASFAMRNNVIYNYDTTPQFSAHYYYAAYNVTIYCFNGSECNFGSAGSNCNSVNIICVNSSACTISSKQYTINLLKYQNKETNMRMNSE